MIPLLSALLTAAAGCTAVPGADRLWQADTRWVIVGELHGTNETPDAFANLVCSAAATGRPVTVAVEYSADGQATIDRYLASDGKVAARAALLTLPGFTNTMQDGRGSVAVARLFDTLRWMKQSGRIRGVVASDVGRSTPPGLERDAAMARNWTAITMPPNGIVLALVGNTHAMRVPATFGERTIVTAGSLMPVERTVTVNVTGSGGQAWNCQADGCGAHESGGAHQVATGITFSTAADRRWDAVYELGVATTAARPARDAR